MSLSCDAVKTLPSARFFSFTSSAPKRDEDAVELRVVVDVFLALLALDEVERRAGDVDFALLHELRHLAVEEREQQRADVRAVHVGVGHDDDPAVAQLGDVERALLLAIYRCRCRWR